MSYKKHFKMGTMLTTLALLFIGTPLYAIHHNSDDFSRRVTFKPLVRHMISQAHCYDSGDDKCETTDHLGTYFVKEHTLGFLIQGSRRHLTSRGLEPLYICDSRRDASAIMVTSTTIDEDPKGICREAGLRVNHMGYIASDQSFEASWPLYRCKHPETMDILLTDTPVECVSATYDEAELLGYLYAGGPLPLN